MVFVSSQSVVQGSHNYFRHILQHIRSSMDGQREDCIGNGMVDVMIVGSILAQEL